MAQAIVFPRTVQQLKAAPRFSHAWSLIATAALAAAGHTHQIPHVYKQAVQPFGPAPAARQPAVADWEADLPRRRVVRQMKEVLIKSTILVGVAHCIEASMFLSSALEEGDFDDTFVREGYDSDGQLLERGTRGLGRIYKQNDASLMQKFTKAGVLDIAWLSRAVTYGALLEPIRPDSPKAALDVFENSLVILTCLMAQKAYREVLWHLRGCVRIGMTLEEVDTCQKAIEVCLQEVDEYRSAAGVGEKKVPRVSDITEEDGL